MKLIYNSPPWISPCIEYKAEALFSFKTVEQTVSKLPNTPYMVADTLVQVITQVGVGAFFVCLFVCFCTLQGLLASWAYFGY